jgi:sigma-B regulation protein RsbQ
VEVRGVGSRPIVFAHGFGCDKSMWRFISPEFERDFKVVLFDHIGAGGSDLCAYDDIRHSKIEVCRELSLTNAIFVGHSVSAMIGVLAARKAPDLFSDLVLVGPSPRYIDDEGYVGGFTDAQISELLDFLDANHMGWSQTMAPVIMGNSDRPELGEELTNSFCRTNPEIAKKFARVTFLSDNRSDLSGLPTRALILQCSEDVIAPVSVGHYVHAQLPNSTLVILEATGHCPNLSAPDETARAIKAHLRV